MNDENIDASVSSFDPRSENAPNGTDDFSTPDPELTDLLGRWTTPAPSHSFDNRILSAYRQQILEDIPLMQQTPASTLSSDNRSEVVKMKKCSTCGEEFANKFGFCPVDGTPLNGSVVTPDPTNADPSVQTASPLYSGVAAAAGAVVASSAAASASSSVRGEFHLTMVDDEGLVSRLATKMRDMGRESQLTWPEFKRDPSGFVKRGAVAYGTASKNFFKRPNVAFATVAGIIAVPMMILGLFLFASALNNGTQALAENNQELVIERMLDIPDEEKPKPEEPDKGIGTGDKGRVGFNKGAGEGSKPKFERAAGGGGGGHENPLPPQRGGLPESNPIPAPIPPVRSPNPPLLRAGIDLDPALRPDVPAPVFGVPNSTSTATSGGPGKGEGIGTGTGLGIGGGEGRGVGPGRGGNIGGGDRNMGGGGAGGGTGNNGIDYNRPFASREVSRKANVTSKPEAKYTEEARRNQTMGTVRLRAVLNANGSVSNISPVQGLPFGLTEKAIEAARQVRFTPAQKDGRSVSQWVTLEYAFTIY
ncbi:MAG: energy transducer TonB [Pyrinomonadaceae bacterium]